MPDSQPATSAERPLSEDEVLDGPRYEAGVMDDLGSINMDFFIYLGEDFLEDVDATLVPKQDNVTLRVTARSVTANTVDGSEDPLWTQDGNEAPSLESYLDDGTDVTLGSSGGGGGCTVGGNRAFDPLLPGLALAALAFLGLRRRWKMPL